MSFRQRQNLLEEFNLNQITVNPESFQFASDLYYECQLCNGILCPYFEENNSCRCQNVVIHASSGAFQVKMSNAIKLFKAMPKYAHQDEPQHQPRCDCPEPMLRTILWSPEWVHLRNRQLDGCLKCGRVFYYEVLVEEPHPHDTRITGFVVLPVADIHLQWLGRWPRWACDVGQFYEPFRRRPPFVGAHFRWHDDDQIEQEISAQKDLSLAQRLEQAGSPQDEPPQKLPDEFNAFAEVWIVLRNIKKLDGKALLDLLPQFRGVGVAGLILMDHIVRDTSLVTILGEQLQGSTVREWQPAISLMAICGCYDQPIPEILESGLFDLLKRFPHVECDHEFLETFIPLLARFGRSREFNAALIDLKEKVRLAESLSKDWKSYLDNMLDSIIGGMGSHP